MAGAPRPRSGNTTLHRDGTVSYWSVYDQRWHRSRAIPDRELAAMDRASRRRVSRHTAKRNPARRQAYLTRAGRGDHPSDVGAYGIVIKEERNGRGHETVVSGFVYERSAAADDDLQQVQQMIHEGVSTEDIGRTLYRQRNPARRQARSTPKGTANQPAAFLLGAVPHAWDTGVPLPDSWQGYALSDPEVGTQWVMYLGRSGGERSYSAIKRWAPDARRKRNGVGSYQGVRYVRKAGVIRYKDPETGRKMKIAQREGGMREFRRRVERYLRRAA